MIAVHRAHPRAWRPDEVRLVGAVVERTWAQLERARAEAEAQEATRRLERAAAVTGLGTLAWRPDTDEVTWDARAAAVLGLPADVLGMSRPAIREFVHLYDRPRLDTAAERLRDGAEQRPLEEVLRLLRPGGSVRWVSLRAQARRATDGVVVEASVLDRTTERSAEVAVRQQGERDGFLLALSDAMRPLSDPLAIQHAAARVLGEHPDADRAYHVDAVDPRAGTVHRGWQRPGLAPEDGRYELAPLGDLIAELTLDETLVVVDAQADERLSAAAREVLLAREALALIAVPLVKEGRLAGLHAVESVLPRRWRPEDVALVEETAERTWAAVERARAEATLRARARRDRRRR
jgi:GAF domain-containing protein